MGSGGEVTSGTLKVEHQSGGYSNLVAGTDYTVTSDITTGKPTTTYTGATTANLNTFSVYECYHRLHSVVRDASNIILASSTSALSGYASTSWNLTNDNGSFRFYYAAASVFNLTSAGTVTINGNLVV